MERNGGNPAKEGGHLARIMALAEHGICYTALGLLALVPVLEALLRQFSLTIPSARAVTAHIFLVLGLFAAMITTKSKEHISIAVVQYIKNEKLKTVLALISGSLSSFLLTLLAWNSASFLRYGLSGRLVGFIPNQVFALAMPIAYAVMALRLALALPWKKARPFLSALPLLLGTACALPAIAKMIWGFEPPQALLFWLDFLYDTAHVVKVPAILLLIAAALAGTPIFAAIGGIAMIILQAAFGEPEAVPIQIYSALTDGDIIAIPLFTLTGFFLSESKAGERLLQTFRSLFNWIPGGMIIATVIICAFFTSFTGASGVTILALGGLLYTILTEKSQYPDRFSIGLLTSSGCIGLLFPPSLPIILVGSTSNTILHFMGGTVDSSILHYFIGALIPGCILVTAMIVFGIGASRRVKIPVEAFEFPKAARSLKHAAFEILLPFSLIALYFSGILSLVEISAVSVFYVFITEVLIHKDIAVADTAKVFLKAVPIIGGVLSILAMAKGLSYAIIDTQVPQNFTRWMQAAVESKYLFLLLLNLALLVVGCLMDIFSAILVVLPLIVPLGQAYGIDPVHLGVIFIINLEVGFLTPPVGMNLFLASYRFKRPFMEICRFVLPFLLIQLVVVFLVTYVPALSTALIKLVR
ncbi:MAG: TRAP transporter large permease subunit [Spirochaetaceae bacterium]|jgi:tripartite ATP-independent transporter DctM subunit|nr:TRAP transporter large permease subunit [Spirochaetaceae bacterium]